MVRSANSVSASNAKDTRGLFIRYRPTDQIASLSSCAASDRMFRREINFDESKQFQQPESEGPDIPCCYSNAQLTEAVVVRGTCSYAIVRCHGSPCRHVDSILTGVELTVDSSVNCQRSTTQRPPLTGRSCQQPRLHQSA